MNATTNLGLLDLIARTVRQNPAKFAEVLSTYPRFGLPAVFAAARARALPLDLLKNCVRFAAKNGSLDMDSRSNQPARVNVDIFIVVQVLTRRVKLAVRIFMCPTVGKKQRGFVLGVAPIIGRAETRLRTFARFARQRSAGRHLELGAGNIMLLIARLSVVMRTQSAESG